MSDRYDEPRAHELRERYHAVFGGDELPVPVESIAEDLLGLAVEARELDVSGMLLPAERRILVNAAEPETRRRFTIAHELGHWICQCLGADQPKPVYCRAEEIGVDPEAKALEREANIFAPATTKRLTTSWVARLPSKPGARRSPCSARRPSALTSRKPPIELYADPTRSYQVCWIWRSRWERRVQRSRRARL